MGETPVANAKELAACVLDQLAGLEEIRSIPMMGG